jgi:hypothetical protein
MPQQDAASDAECLVESSAPRRARPQLDVLGNVPDPCSKLPGLVRLRKSEIRKSNFEIKVCPHLAQIDGRRKPWDYR